jgi:LuxR family transcriptional regulator, activator of conjugal transfer of Ti plasmids
LHRTFQAFIDGLSASVDALDLHRVMADAASDLELPCFAYLALPPRGSRKPDLISSYPVAWTSHYLARRYERVDPVISQAASRPQPFEWGLSCGLVRLSRHQKQLLDEAAGFGIRCGFTIPIHDTSGIVAAVTFAADERRPAFRRNIAARAEVLQLMALFFHAHARRKLGAERAVEGVALSPREFECLRWSAQGKSAWEIGCILGISRRTVSFHLDNAKAKLGVRTVRQAAVRLAAARPTLLR